MASRMPQGMLVNSGSDVELHSGCVTMCHMSNVDELGHDSLCPEQLACCRLCIRKISNLSAQYFPPVFVQRQVLQCAGKYFVTTSTRL